MVQKEDYMKQALKQAEKAYKKLEVPVGAVIVKDGKIIARAHNQKETRTDTTKHAEILAIQKASKKLESWRLIDCEMYVTLEPCSMCAGAMINSRIKKVYIGAMDEKTGAAGSVLNLFNDYTFNHKVEVENGVMKTECQEILKKFFKELRELKRGGKNVIIIAILSVGGMLILRYQVEGESNMPFKISKISIIESVEGVENQGTEEKWNFNVNENNDIYIYLEKNSAYGKTEIIDSVELKDIKAIKEKDIGKIKFYKPVTDEKRMFINQADSEMLGITYKGEMESNIKEQKISNQGGIMAFRYAINNISQYVSQDAEEIDHAKLLKLTNITEEDLKTTLSFDMIINLNSGKKYQAPISFDIPTDEIIEKGTVGIDKTDLNNIIFKRIEN